MTRIVFDFADDPNPTSTSAGCRRSRLAHRKLAQACPLPCRRDPSRHRLRAGDGGSGRWPIHALAQEAATHPEWRLRDQGLTASLRTRRTFCGRRCFRGVSGSCCRLSFLLVLLRHRSGHRSVLGIPLLLSRSAKRIANFLASFGRHHPRAIRPGCIGFYKRDRLTAQKADSLIKAALL